VVAAGPVRNLLTRVASDHFPLLAELRVRNRPRAARPGHAQATEDELL